MNSISMLLNLIYNLKINEKRLNENVENNYEVCQEACKKLIDSSRTSLITYGKDNIIKDGPILITSNHNSFYDIFALVSVIDRPMTFAAAKELMKYPVLNKYISALNCVLIDRNINDLKIMKQQLQAMEEKINSPGLILFPEGECSYATGNIKDFKKGGFIITNNTNIPIVPTYIKSDNMKKIGNWYVPSSDIKIIFGKPFIPNETFSKKISAKKLSEYTREKVLELKRSI